MVFKNIFPKLFLAISCVFALLYWLVFSANYFDRVAAWKQEKLYIGQSLTNVLTAFAVPQSPNSNAVEDWQEKFDAWFLQLPDALGVYQLNVLDDTGRYLVSNDRALVERLVSADLWDKMRTQAPLQDVALLSLATEQDTLQVWQFVQTVSLVAEQPPVYVQILFSNQQLQVINMRYGLFLVASTFVLFALLAWVIKICLSLLQKNVSSLTQNLKRQSGSAALIPVMNELKEVAEWASNHDFAADEQKTINEENAPAAAPEHNKSTHYSFLVVGIRYLGFVNLTQESTVSRLEQLTADLFTLHEQSMRKDSANFFYSDGEYWWFSFIGEQAHQNALDFSQKVCEGFAAFEDFKNTITPICLIGESELIHLWLTKKWPNMPIFTGSGFVGMQQNLANLTHEGIWVTRTAFDVLQKFCNLSHTEEIKQLLGDVPSDLLLVNVHARTSSEKKVLTIKQEDAVKRDLPKKTKKHPEKASKNSKGMASVLDETFEPED